MQVEAVLTRLMWNRCGGETHTEHITLNPSVLSVAFIATVNEEVRGRRSNAAKGRDGSQPLTRLFTSEPFPCAGQWVNQLLSALISSYQQLISIIIIRLCVPPRIRRAPILSTTIAVKRTIASRDPRSYSLLRQNWQVWVISRQSKKKNKKKPHTITNSSETAADTYSGWADFDFRLWGDMGGQRRRKIKRVGNLGMHTSWVIRIRPCVSYIIYNS